MMKTFLTAVILVFLSVGGAGAKQPVPTPGKGHLSGRVVNNMEGGAALSRAIISIFDVAGGPPPDTGVIRRVPEGIIRVKRSGMFKIVLPPGEYFLGVLFRKDQSRNGPPGPGEKFFFPRDGKGELRKFKIVEGKTTETGILNGDEPETLPEIANPLSIEGTIYDDQGKPFGGALILVRRNLTTPRPLFISEKTGPDGKYRLKLPAGRPYFLVVRENLVNVGRPRPGDFVGTFGGSPPQAAGKAPSVFSGGKPVTGKENQVLKGIDITMYKIPDPEEVKKRLVDESAKPILPGSSVPQPPGAMKSKKAGADRP